MTVTFPVRPVTHARFACPFNFAAIHRIDTANATKASLPNGINAITSLSLEISSRDEAPRNSLLSHSLGAANHAAPF
jgi:hypothetical protein